MTDEVEQFLDALSETTARRTSWSTRQYWLWSATVQPRVARRFGPPLLDSFEPPWLLSGVPGGKVAARSRYGSANMMVTDLHHYLDLPDEVPGPARRLAEQLDGVVRAATAGDAGVAWESALPCRRRPGNRRCPQRMVVLRSEASAPIRWQCSVCGDEGVISNWAESPADLRQRRLTPVGDVHEIVISADVAAAVRELRLLDPDCERVVFGIHAHPGRTDRADQAVLVVSDHELEDLIGYVAAEANHESSRRRQQRLDTAFDALGNAAQSIGQSTEDG